MPINTRTIAISVAVICFFVLSLLGWINGLSPFTCWKRATMGAVIAYVAAVCAVKAINAILINAIITSQVNRQKETGSGSTDSKDS
jgi:hypothetical protein